MLTGFLILLPSLTAFGVFARLKLKKQKTHSTIAMSNIIFMGALYLLADAFYIMPTSNYRVVIAADTASQFIKLFNPPAIYMLVRAFSGKRSIGLGYTMLYTPGVLFGAAAIVLYSLMGSSAQAFIMEMDLTGGHPLDYNYGVYRTYICLCRYGASTLAITEIIMIIAYSLRIMLKNGFRFSGVRAFFKSKKNSPLNTSLFLLIMLLTLCVLKGCMGRPFLLMHPELSCTLSLIITITIGTGAYAGSSFSEKEVVISSLWNTPEAVIERETPAISNSAGKQIVSSSRRAQINDDFHKFFVVGQAFLDPEISLESICEELKINRTYISAYLNKENGMTFRNFLNKNRIEYAKDIMRKNPGISLEAIAKSSGFLSTSQFNKKFKELEGITPGAWSKHLI